MGENTKAEKQSCLFFLTRNKNRDLWHAEKKLFGDSVLGNMFTMCYLISHTHILDT